MPDLESVIVKQQWRTDGTITGNSQWSFNVLNTLEKGQSVKDWRTILRDGGNAETFMEGTETTFNVSEMKTSKEGIPGTGAPLTKFQYHGLPGIGVYLQDATAGEFADLRTRVMTKYLADAQKSSKLLGGAFVYELGKSKAMIAGRSKKLYDWMVSNPPIDLKFRARKLGYRDVAVPLQKLSKDLAGLVLEYNMGWVPLYNDLAGAWHQWGRDREPGIKEVFAQGQLDGNYQSGRSVANYGGIPHWKWEETSYRRSCRFYGKAVAAVETSSWGFSSQDIVPTVYEVIPWSFLVDYFSNLGTFLEAQQTVNSHLKWTSELNFVEQSYEWFSVPNQNWDSRKHYKWQATGGSLNKKVKTFSRMPNVSASAGVVLKLPKLSRQWINMAALATGAMPPFVRGS